MTQASWEFIKAVAEARFDDAHEAIASGADINYVDSNGQSAAHYCAKEDGRERILFLHSVGASLEIEQTKNCKRRPAHIAAYEGFPEALIALHECGVDINAPDEWRETPLHRAALARKDDCVRTLLTLGADPLRFTAQGDSPLHYGLSSPTITVMLLEAGSEPMLRDRLGWNAFETAAQRFQQTLPVLQSWKARQAAATALDEIQAQPKL